MSDNMSIELIEQTFPEINILHELGPLPPGHVSLV
jgi:hypothetical protein